jgi:hypothetical protein
MALRAAGGDPVPPGNIALAASALRDGAGYGGDQDGRQR